MNESKNQNKKYAVNLEMVILQQILKFDFHSSFVFEHISLFGHIQYTF